MSSTLKYFNRYKCDGGKSVRVGGVKVGDEKMAEFHREGLAKEFDMVGNITRTIT
jgi:hypothetical protein